MFIFLFSYRNPILGMDTRFPYSIYRLLLHVGVSVSTRVSIHCVSISIFYLCRSIMYGPTIHMNTSRDIFSTKLKEMLHLSTFCYTYISASIRTSRELVGTQPYLVFGVDIICFNGILAKWEILPLSISQCYEWHLRDLAQSSGIVESIGLLVWLLRLRNRLFYILLYSNIMPCPLVSWRS